MQLNTLVLPLALLLIAASVPVFARTPPALRGGVLTLLIGFGLWYWLPALNVLAIGYTGTGSLKVPRATAYHAAWLVLGYQATALLACRGLVRWSRPDAPDPPATLPAPNLFSALGAAVLLSSLALVFMRFADPLLALRVLAGMTSARDHLTFFNRSSGAAESLLKLWEIVNLWAALFVLATAIDTRRALGTAALLAVAALIVGFLGSGTRTVLLMAGFVAVAAMLLRPPGKSTGPAPRWGLLALGSLLLLAAVALAGRFKDGALKVFADTLLVNTDMLSETAFVLDRFRNYVPARVTDFVATPVTFLLPRFLGFDKATPEHLIAYNRARAGYDIVHGEGNVFPGIVGDFHMVFAGLAGAALFALFIVAVIAAVELLGRAITPGPLRRAWQIAVYAFLLISLRNIQGSLVLIIIAGLALALGTQLVQRLARRS